MNVPKQGSKRRLLNVAISAVVLAFAVAAAEMPDHTTWRDYLGNADSSHYSALHQINRSNVSKLEVAWTYPTGDEEAYVFNPLVVDNTMYVVAKKSAIVALNATTGTELWSHPMSSDASRFEKRRGLNYWESKDRSDRRILFWSRNFLQAIDARTGNQITSFGKNGLVDLKENLGRDAKQIRRIQSGSPGRVFENLLIVGSSPGEDYDSPPGHIRAYNVITGELAWTFHTIPYPGEFGYETWPKDAWKTAGGVNTWGEMTIDEKRGLVFLPVGSPTYDFYAADRIGANLFADCLLVLDARTGKRVWHYQMVHHDLWDYDGTAAPQLLTVKHDGKTVDVVAQASKQGFVYVLDRETGKPIWPIEERPVPKTDMPGEQSWPTQPFPTIPPPFGRQKFTADDVNPYLDVEVRAKLRDRLLSARNEGLFTPPGFRDTVQMPGNNGGCNFHCSATDPASGTLYVLSKDVPSILKLERTPPRMNLPVSGTPAQQGRVLYAQNCQICHGTQRQGQLPVIPSLVDITKTRNADAIKSIVTAGQGQMPSFARLPEPALNALVAYLSNPAAGEGTAESADPHAIQPSLPSKAADETKAPRYWTGYGYLESKDIPSPITPPWSALTAYDLNTGTIKWKVPYGNVAEYEAKGITGTGTIWPKSGVAVTAGGLIFGASRADGKLRAYDQDNGKVMWETELPAGSEGVPAVYEVNGREYVVVCATSPKMSRPSIASGVPDAEKRSYVAYALPKGFAATDQ